MSAPDYTGYKALICIFLNGGNQSYNWIVPNDYTASSVNTNQITKDSTYIIRTLGNTDWNSLSTYNSWKVTASGKPVVGSTFTAAVTSQISTGGVVSKLTDGSKYNEYKTARRAVWDPLDPTGGLAHSRSVLWPLLGQVASDGNPYGLHPSCKDMAKIFNDGDAAVICNVGTLKEPLTKADVLAYNGKVPHQLFSHIDQQLVWQRAIADQLTKSGWGGRVVDLYEENGVNPQLNLSIGITDKSLFLAGESTNQYITGSASTPADITTLTNGWRGGARGLADAAILNQAITSSNPLTKTFAQIRKNADTNVALLKTALSSVTVNDSAFKTTTTLTYDSYIGLQLKQVAKLIKANAAAFIENPLTDRRQVFFTVQYGFDGHDYEYESQERLLLELNNAIKALSDELKSVNLWDKVTIFTNSEFSRSVAPNYDGSDHAWGGHSMVFGGAVKGGYYGTMPSLVIGGADDIQVLPDAKGRIIPTTSVEQYSATLAKWIGVQEADLPSIFPNLTKFTPTIIPFMD